MICGEKNEFKKGGIALEKIRRKSKLIFFCLLVSLSFFTFHLQVEGKKAKTLEQLQREHAELRFGVMMHFNMNTFYPGWGNLKVDPKLFNPTKLDCNQWAAACKSAGARYAILTAKHHDGFCLWDSKYTDYDVMSSSYPHDIIKLYTNAFRKRGILPGLYFSIWDVAHQVRFNNWDTKKELVLGQLTELLTNYGEIPVIVFDGWAWKMGHKAIPYQEIREHVKKLQPNCLIVDLNGLSEPWEVDVIFYEETKDVYCPVDNTHASCQAMPISGDWFWSEDASDINKLKSLDLILDHLNKLEPRYCNFLLNVAPNREGLYDQSVVTRMAEIGKKWKPNKKRPPLPPQVPVVEHPITPKSATATSGNGSKAIDGINDRGWGPEEKVDYNQTLWRSEQPLPQAITIDLGNVYNDIDILHYLPCQGPRANGFITSYKIYASVDGTNFTQIAEGKWESNRKLKVVEFPPVQARFIKLEALEAESGEAVVNEITIGGRIHKPYVSTQ